MNRLEESCVANFHTDSTISYEQYDSLCVSQDETSVERNSVTPQPESIDRNMLPLLPETIDQNVLPPTFEIDSSGATNVICDTDDAENRKKDADDVVAWKKKLKAWLQK